ncbi:YihY/virulence factor BrkB family protein [Paractinoplanes globisporus]|uniref:YihY/virulence factor BrkB family protein n=1 Tax=Paractinoplanes globisporus TaxID=113565 RepID=A0ABW6WGE0_9ACTN|nr:YhjD/YihY/BrkB family envelope integrity protein [Actinoplanes globisporus]
MNGLLARLDRFQRGHGWAALPYAVIRKYLDDDGPRHAALITYYGFLSLFPLLLLGVAIVSRLLATDPELRHSVITAIVPPALQNTVDDAAAALPTSPVAFVIGAIGLIWSATGVVFAAYRTLNHVAAVRMRDMPEPIGAYLRVIGVALLLLAGVVAGGGLTVAGAALPNLGVPDRLLAALGTGFSAFAVLLFGVRILLLVRAPFSALWRPAAAGGLLLAIVLHVGAPLLTILVRKAGPVYGAFATVAGLFTLLYVVSQALVLVAEIAAVRHARLWPRALDPADPTAADERALQLLAREQERIPGQVVESHIIRDA